MGILLLEQAQQWFRKMLLVGSGNDCSEKPSSTQNRRKYRHTSQRRKGKSSSIRRETASTAASSTQPAKAKEIRACPPLSLKPSKRQYEIAIVACGCFWSPQHRFRKVRGIKRVIAGYTGGIHTSPTWHNVRDHTQALFVEYDPKVINYIQILQLWRENDDPWQPEPNVHLQSALFCTSESQYKQAIDYLYYTTQSRAPVVVGEDGCNDSRGEYEVPLLQVRVELAFSPFYQAEEYQQYYLAKQLDAAKQQLLLWAKKA